MVRGRRDPYELKLKLLRYLKEEKPFNKNLAVTASYNVMETNWKKGLQYLREMEVEGLIEIHKPDKTEFVNGGIVTITQKGLVAGDMLTQMIGMCSKGGEYLH